MLRQTSLRDRFKQFRRKRSDPLQVQQLVADLEAESRLDEIYLFLIIGSCAIATFGLLSNSAAVIIGAMIVAPLMLPIRGLALGALVGNLPLFRQGAISVVTGTGLAIVISWLLGMLVALPNYGSEVLARSEPTLLDLGIAVAAGGISGYAKVEPKIAGSLAGTAIAVALMPPVCVIGLGLAANDWSLSLGASLLYLTNLLGITLSCMLTFLIAGYTRLRHARKALTWATILTVILLIPLGVSFARLIRQAQLQASLEQALLNRTVTFQRLELLSTNVNWFSSPPTVRLNVRAREPVTPRQVQLLEDFISQEMEQSFRLIFEVGQVEEVRSSDN
ncbi:MAG: TIGR00341 family protein [Leptolyngbyaceae cyanobacterium CSU_1_3]|nr:TIGR00341 family protein [Leptolyngbyaceae cyanobacterium CSU_1_3]